jgi:glycosyltransferase involved in cell wall biosynthesis
MLRAMRAFRDAPEKIIVMQEVAAKRISKKYSWDKIVHQYLDLYIKALEMVN